MKILGYTFFEKAEAKSEIQAFTKPQINIGYSSGAAWSYSFYNGEKNLGAIGPVQEYNIDGVALRSRGWEAYLTNETVQTIINKMIVWVIGRGLRLQSEPAIAVLKSEGIELSKEQSQEISDIIEARFSLYKEQSFSTYCKEKNLSQFESTAFKNCKVGGDVLAVIYFDGEFPSIRLIDGAHVKSPQGGDDWNPRVLLNGNRIVNGVEMNENGEHIAYHIMEADCHWKRIEAKSKSTGMKMAYLVGGLEYRLDYVRCTPAISGVLEVLATMDRYKMATLETAEETSKVAWQIVYGTTSSGENPMAKQIASARDLDGNKGIIPVDEQLKVMADKVAVTTGKQAVQNVIDSEIKPLEKSKGELYFKDFYSMFFDIVCAAVNMPPNVAMSKYDSSFSSARAAIKDWEHTLIIERYNFALAFLQPIYEMWLYIEVRKNKIQLPGYLNALSSGNRMIVASYNAARWVGDSVPHIDPLKEVKAVREMLGDTGASLPLIDHEGAVERLGGGNAKSIMSQYAGELDESKALGIEPPEKPEPTKEGSGGVEDVQAQIKELESKFEELKDDINVH